MPFPNLEGRPSKYDEDMPSKIVPYLEQCVIDEEVPTTAGFAIYLGVPKRTLYDWAKEHDQLSHTIYIINTVQEQQLVTGGLKSKYNPMITKLMLSANHGYAEKTESKVDQNTNLTGDVNVHLPLKERLSKALDELKDLQTPD